MVLADSKKTENYKDVLVKIMGTYNLKFLFLVKSFNKDCNLMWESTAIPNYTMKPMLAFHLPPSPRRKKNKTHH